MIICLKLAKEEKHGGSPMGGFMSQAWTWHPALPTSFHSPELSHMAHLTAGGAGKCSLTVSPGRTGQRLGEEPASLCHAHTRNFRDASSCMNGTPKSWPCSNEGEKSTVSKI